MSKSKLPGYFALGGIEVTAFGFCGEIYGVWDWEGVAGWLAGHGGCCLVMQWR
jgi:hypothetical protein